MSTALFCVTCTADDPQAPARVMGVFAARSLLPRRFCSLLVGDPETVEIEIEIDGGELDAIEHLARILARFPTVTRVRLEVGGKDIAFEPICVD